MKKAIASLACALLLTAHSHSHAYVDCQGTITNLSLILYNGIVTLSLSGGPNYTYLCGIETAQNSVSPNVCRAMYATLVAAKATGKQILIRFNDYNSCTSVPAWGFPGSVGWTVLLID